MITPEIIDNLQAITVNYLSSCRTIHYLLLEGSFDSLEPMVKNSLIHIRDLCYELNPRIFNLKKEI